MLEIIVPENAKADYEHYMERLFYRAKPILEQEAILLQEHLESKEPNARKQDLKRLQAVCAAFRKARVGDVRGLVIRGATMGDIDALHVASKLVGAEEENFLSHILSAMYASVAGATDAS